MRHRRPSRARARPAREPEVKLVQESRLRLYVLLCDKLSVAARERESMSHELYKLSAEALCDLLNASEKDAKLERVGGHKVTYAPE